MNDSFSIQKVDFRFGDRQSIQRCAAPKTAKSKFERRRVSA
jgi:hypothetical protein